MLVATNWTKAGIITVAAKKHDLDDGELIKIEDVRGEDTKEPTSTLVQVTNLLDLLTAEEPSLVSSLFVFLTIKTPSHFFQLFAKKGDVSKKDENVGPSQNIQVLNGAQGIKVHRVWTKFHYATGNITFSSNGKELSYEDVGESTVNSTVDKWSEALKEETGEKKTKGTRMMQVFNCLKLDLSEATYKTSKGQKSISLSKLSAWKTGGIITQVKRKIPLTFDSLEVSLENPSKPGHPTYGPQQTWYGPQHPRQNMWEAGVGKTIHLAYFTALEFEVGISPFFLFFVFCFNAGVANYA